MEAILKMGCLIFGIVLLLIVIAGIADSDDHSSSYEYSTPTPRSFYESNTPSPTYSDSSTAAPVYDEPVRTYKRSTADDIFEEGYDEGYAQGYEDGRYGYGYQANFDDSSPYYDFKEERYRLGYEDGYEDGYYDGVADRHDEDGDDDDD